MSVIEKTDLSKVAFSSTVFPTSVDMELWDSLTSEEQRAVVVDSLDKAEASGIAKNSSMHDLIALARQ